VLRRIIFASQHMMNRALAGEESPDEILAGAEETLLKLGEARMKSGLLNAGQILEDYEGGLNAFLDPSKRIKGISTGFAKFDELTGGLHGGDLVIVAGRPSMGKTAWRSTSRSTWRSRTSRRWRFFRSKCRRSRCSPACCARRRAWTARSSARGTSLQEERRKLNQALHELVQAPLYIDDTPART
jgi:replicative DNA helicase